MGKAIVDGYSHGAHLAEDGKRDIIKNGAKTLRDQNFALKRYEVSVPMAAFIPLRYCETEKTSVIYFPI